MDGKNAVNPRLMGRLIPAQVKGAAAKKAVIRAATSKVCSTAALDFVKDVRGR